MVFSFSERSLTSGEREHVVMVVTPKRPMVLGRARLAALRKPVSLSEVDRQLIRECARRSSRAHVVILRGVDVLGAPGWSFDPELGEDEGLELGYLLTGALLPVHRRILAAGMATLIHSDWGEREYAAMRHGVTRFAEELSAQASPTPTERADQWILRNMLFHFALPLDRIVEAVLPGHLSLLQSRAARMKDLLRELPPEALD
jgi:hypothetical protein